MVYMPVISASWLERNIRESDLRVGDVCYIAVAREIFGVCRVGFAYRKDHFLLESLVVGEGIIVVPYFFAILNAVQALGQPA